MRGCERVSEGERYVQLEKMDDLVRMMATSMSPPPLHHVKMGKKHVYLLPASMGLGRAVIYFVEAKEAVEKKYVVYDTIHDKVSFSDEISTKPSLKHFSVVEIKAQNILPKRALKQ